MNPRHLILFIYLTLLIFCTINIKTTLAADDRCDGKYINIDFDFDYSLFFLKKNHAMMNISSSYLLTNVIISSYYLLKSSIFLYNSKLV
ncbi:hypothetical protein RhiirA4_539614 [Rhizophagus irregularis]|uniref:Uncharacterized protein n=1 Tax=Rhizophagus irregularis TaxID=588596 RepID=A0A2I1G4G8_9GLOM|nr:hypothetical protein RhiirA4_539614 [Rhizophagus irregularis]